MRAIGLLLVTLGFLGASFVAVIDPPGVGVAVPEGSVTPVLEPVLQEAGVAWPWFVPPFVLGVIGVVLVQIAVKRQATDTDLMEANFEALDQRLRSIVDEVETFDERKTEIDTYDLPAYIDETFPKDLIAFVEARESIAHAWGAQAYADIMSHFATGDRYLNRVWSCAADGYIDEAHRYIGLAREQFGEALARFESLGKR